VRSGTASTLARLSASVTAMQSSSERTAVLSVLSFCPPLQLVRRGIATGGRCVLTRFGLRIENSPDEPTAVGSALGVFSCPARDATADTVCFDAVIPCALPP
jgi:hypothetical protein